MLLATESKTLTPVLEDVLRALDERLLSVLSDESGRWSREDDALGHLPDLLSRFVAQGGKRLRPAFLFAGFLACDADASRCDAVDMAAALELLHAFALIHDDVMDGSLSRRGSPAMHIELERWHEAAGGRGDGRRFGEGLAVLAGDLALVYADRLVPRVPALLAVWDEMRVELTMGQYLDLTGAALGRTTPSRAMRIAILKSGRYTVVRPLHLAALLAERCDVIQPFHEFGEPLGRAFQLRDDVLGAFGSPNVTGKPAGDDLREGKPTLLLELARSRASAQQLAVLQAAGSPDLRERDVEAIRQVLADTGALAAVEQQIEHDWERALDALAAAPITSEGMAALEQLAWKVVHRSF